MLNLFVFVNRLKQLSLNADLFMCVFCLFVYVFCVCVCVSFYFFFLIFLLLFFIRMMLINSFKLFSFNFKINKNNAIIVCILFDGLIFFPFIQMHHIT